ncbi:MAG: D-glycero-beta-D-manno-heptose 1-phosphate adenylyltransferase [Fusobacteria bacterium]|nr:D-glycero-beta-D-manno-heptose 1-phosphate adenylyltransferase [Fusobacteriota bacterium]
MNTLQTLELLHKLKADGKKIVFTNGCFDILHVGHLRYLNAAKKLGDYLVVGVNSDASVRILKGPKKPYVNEIERCELLEGLKAVDFTLIFDEQTPIELIKKVQPSIHVKGGDYTVDSLPETPIVESFCGKVVILNFTEGSSTSNIVKNILERN